MGGEDDCVREHGEFHPHFPSSWEPRRAQERDRERETETERQRDRETEIDEQMRG